MPVVDLGFFRTKPLYCPSILHMITVILLTNRRMHTTSAMDTTCCYNFRPNYHSHNTTVVYCTIVSRAPSKRLRRTEFAKELGLSGKTIHALQESVAQKASQGALQTVEEAVTKCLTSHLGTGHVKPEPIDGWYHAELCMMKQSNLTDSITWQLQYCTVQYCTGI